MQRPPTSSFRRSHGLTLAFAGASLAGKSLVAFEKMEFEGAEYMVHADIDDVEQTVAIVDIATQARDAETDTNTGTIGEHVKLIDTVAYTGVEPGNAYKLFAMLMDKTTGNPLMAMMACLSWERPSSCPSLRTPGGDIRRLGRSPRSIPSRPASQWSCSAA